MNIDSAYKLLGASPSDSDDALRSKYMSHWIGDMSNGDKYHEAYDLLFLHCSGISPQDTQGQIYTDA